MCHCLSSVPQHQPRCMAHHGGFQHCGLLPTGSFSWVTARPADASLVYCGTSHAAKASCRMPATRAKGYRLWIQPSACMEDASINAGKLKSHYYAALKVAQANEPTIPLKTTLQKVSQGVFICVTEMNHTCTSPSCPEVGLFRINKFCTK